MEKLESNTNQRLWLSLSALFYIPSLFFSRVVFNGNETSSVAWFWNFLGHIFDKHACLPGLCSEASLLLFWALVLFLPAFLLGWLVQSAIVFIQQIMSAHSHQEIGAPYFTRLGLKGSPIRECVNR